MADKLLVRAYNVEVGDCIYCRIPKARKVGTVVDDFHMLIDCGSVGTPGNLATAIADLETQLPLQNGKRRLDLLVVTHEHKDHIAGFDPDVFENIRIERIWMNTAMDPDHPQAEQTLRLRSLATTAMRNIAALNLALSPELAELAALFAVDNDAAMEALRDTLPARNNITPTYVHAGMTPADLDLPLKGATIRVLSPERDIDHFYLGEEIDESLLRLMASGAAFGDAPLQPTTVYPANISQADFQHLQSRMMSSAFAFAELSSKVTNNTSVVLLIEWKSKRLLFVGDAEWDMRFKDGKSNGAWNVMWHERKTLLNKKIDFLKIGHHGSENATPWNDQEDGAVTEPSTILDAILPLPKGTAKPKARAIVSTKRKNYETIPRSALLAEIGRRVQNARNYKDALGLLAPTLPKYADFEKSWISLKQPWRTDLEQMLTGQNFVDVEV
jgi:beta-lactamase superfamily II metal-dependent hydrolase